MSKPHILYILWSFIILSLLRLQLNTGRLTRIQELETNTENLKNENYTKYMNPEFDKVYIKYVKKHNKIIANLLASSNNSSELPKVVVVRPDMHSGFGNRMPGIICGFLYSLISDRLFFIDGYQNFDNYFEKDFDHNWDTVSYLYRGSTAKDLHVNETINNFTLVTRGNFSSEEINSYDILRVHTWDYVCAPLSSNPYYKEWFNKIIPDYRIFTTISLRLLRLHPDLKSQVEEYANNNFSDYNIGIHLRERKIKNDTNSLMIPIGHYYEAVRMLMLEVKNKNVSIFVAADTTDGRNKLVNLLNNMDLNNTITWENSGTEAGAIIDLKLLGICDDLVLTYASSFGFLAAGWSHKASRQRGLFIINPIKKVWTDNLQVIDKVWMWGAISSEPCMYMSKLLITNEDEETTRIFKSNPLWIHYSQCHYPIEPYKKS
ncbi:34132_t:CDS:2 [Gigaspora margarita]|uniref:34132_t:CDS:1 n=1 Tax=Gigaspora margarita TaxID=4874 RepID=A0ABM8W4A4_GIGMA|nr:34132_t:CDS:2 [Gigaspora margarita]